MLLQGAFSLIVYPALIAEYEISNAGRAKRVPEGFAYTELVLPPAMLLGDAICIIASPDSDRMGYVGATIAMALLAIIPLGHGGYYVSNPGSLIKDGSTGSSSQFLSTSNRFTPQIGAMFLGNGGGGLTATWRIH